MDQFPVAWRPSPGERIRGKVVDLDVRHGDYEPYPIVTLETDDRKVAVHAFHEVLAAELARRSPKRGDELEITYHGKHAEKGYHVYTVTSDGDAPFSWGRFGGIPTEDDGRRVPVGVEDDEHAPDEEGGGLPF